MRILFLLLLAILNGCYTIPETGRSALNVLPESNLIQAATLAFEQLKRTLVLSYDFEDNLRVQRVGRRIAAAEGNAFVNVDWEWVVFKDDDQVNAFAMPGRKVGVYTGLLRFVENDDQLAIVIGHEIAHVAARHVNERVSQTLLIQTGALGIALGTRSTSVATQKAIREVYRIGSHLGVHLPFSRRQEIEADTIGLLYTARAGFDPREALPFWEKMEAAAQRHQPLEWLSTHPHSETRIQNLKAFLPEAMKEYETAKALEDLKRIEKAPQVLIQ